MSRRFKQSPELVEGQYSLSEAKGQVEKQETKCLTSQNCNAL
ncbi:MAG: hypothetical protein KKH08_03270 [Candidatus Omnitrophica bacterium]|nr:hypothetical protein [Candidatus Omnitrophota bacterium]